ncbi:O-antigen ligase family protein [Vibrio sp. HN007]|uniref:O-antigen ligase family protein n=1 Tax=Vibrio iocasae TaxID=3098914 RepID=UPI0035D5216E
MSSTIRYNKKTALLSLCLAIVLTIIWFKLPHPAIVFVLAMLPVGILLVTNQVFWFVLLFVVFSFFRIHEAIPVLYSLKIPLLLSLGALAGLCWHLFISRKLVPYWHPTLNWLGVFWILVLIGLFAASNRPVAISYFNSIYWKIILMSLAIMWIINTRRQLEHVSITIVIAGLIVSLIALQNAHSGIGLVEGNRVTIGRQIGSMLGDPNDLALVLMFPFAFATSVFLSKGYSTIFRCIALLTSITLFLAVLETQSRGGLLGVLAVGGIFVRYYVRSNMLLGAITIPLALVLYLVAGISDRTSGGSAEEGIDASAMGRLYAWEAAFKMALDNPITGVGLNNFYFNYFYYSTHWDGLNHAVHSTWFGVLAETGFAGLIAFVAFLVSLIRLASKTVTRLRGQKLASQCKTFACAKAVHAGLIGTVVSGTFLTQGFNWPIYILASLTIVVAQIASQNENRTD